MAIRLVALDIDGTLLDSQGELPLANVEAIAAAQAVGLAVTLVTARQRQMVAPLAEALKLTGPLVLHNGAVVWLPQENRETLRLTIDLEHARAIAAYADDREYELITTVDEDTFLRCRPGKPCGRIREGLYALPTNLEALTRPPTRIAVRDQAAALDIHRRFARRMADKTRMDIYFRNVEPWGLGIFNHRASKGQALAFVCRWLGIDETEVLAMGDNPVDAEMFPYAGVGIAPGNAPDAVKAQASAVAPSNDEACVAWAIERYVLRGGG
jgi:Cof subfamily protein (haloacid dehalogenase superfamily)